MASRSKGLAGACTASWNARFSALNCIGSPASAACCARASAASTAASDRSVWAPAASSVASTSSQVRIEIRSITCSGETAVTVAPRWLWKLTSPSRCSSRSASRIGISLNRSSPARWRRRSRVPAFTSPCSIRRRSSA